eukprot:4948990-Amphidinium_carterae.3
MKIALCRMPWWTNSGQDVSERTKLIYVERLEALSAHWHSSECSSLLQVFASEQIAAVRIAQFIRHQCATNAQLLAAVKRYILWGQASVYQMSSPELVLAPSRRLLRAWKRHEPIIPHTPVPLDLALALMSVFQNSFGGALLSCVCGRSLFSLSTSSRRATASVATQWGNWFPESLEAHAGTAGFARLLSPVLDAGGGGNGKKRWNTIFTRLSMPWRWRSFLLGSSVKSSTLRALQELSVRTCRPPHHRLLLADYLRMG